MTTKTEYLSVMNSIILFNNVKINTSSSNQNVEMFGLKIRIKK